MKKHRLLYSFAAAALVSSILLSGCGSGSSSSSYSTSTAAETADEGSGYSYDGIEGYSDAAAVADLASDGEMNKTTGSSGETISSSEAQYSDYSQKLIYTYQYDFETLDYDASMNFINTKLTEYGGYMENYSVYGSENRYGDMTLRIPKEHIQDFVNSTGSIGEVISQYVSAQDVTLDYYDAEDRLKTLETKHERLLALMEKAETLTDIAQLESELSDCEYEIDNYQTQLKVYDNQIEYVTVYINLSEVHQIGTVESDSFLERIQKGLASSTSGLIDNLVDLIVWLIVSLPYLILLAIIIIIIVLIVRRVRRKKAAKKAKLSGGEQNPGNKQV